VQHADGTFEPPKPIPTAKYWHDQAVAQQKARDLAENPPLTNLAQLPLKGILSTLQAARKVPGAIQDNTPDWLDKILQAIPGHPGELSALSAALGPALRFGGDTAGAAKAGVKSTVQPAIDAVTERIPGMNIGKSVGRLRESFGAAPEEIAANAKREAELGTFRAGEKGSQEELMAAESARKARMAEIAHGQGTAKAKQQALTVPEKILQQHVGTPAAPEEVGAGLQERIGSRMNSMYEQRAGKAQKAYTAATNDAKLLEASGNGFNKSAPGRKLLAELNTLKAPRAGHAPLTPEQSNAIDRLIDTIEGKAPPGGEAPIGSGKISGKLTQPKEPGEGTPAAHEALVARLRELRKVDERSAPTEGFAALGKKFANELSSRLENAMYEWNPKYRAADEAYKAASERLNVFDTESLRRATRGEKFDFRQMAASPSEFAGRFFKDTQSVQQLKEAVDDPQLVASAARDWAASQLRGKSAAAAKEWSVKNAPWLREAGADKNVEAYIANLSKHEDSVATAAEQAAEREKTLRSTTAQAKAAMESAAKRKTETVAGIEKTREQKQALSESLGTMLKSTDPGNIASTFETKVLPQIKETGAMSEQDIQKMTEQIAEINKRYQGAERKKHIALTIAKYAGAGVGASLVLGSKHAGAAELSPEDEKERRRQALIGKL